MATASPADSIDPPRPWWRHPMLWLVIGGPAAVVVAGIVTTTIAVRGADLPLSTTARQASTTPAQQARNHAAAPLTPARP